MKFDQQQWLDRNGWWIEWSVLLAFAALFFLAAVQVARADSCGVGVRSCSTTSHYRAPYVQQHAQVQHFFFVGLPIRVEAIAAKAQVQANSATAGASIAGKSASIADKCAKCHSAGRAEGDFSLDDLQKRSLDVVRRLVHPDPKERMPPPSEPELSADERGALQQEALGFK